MTARWTTSLLTLGVTLYLLFPAHAQTGGGPDAMNIINNLTPGLHAKVRALAQLLDQSIKTGQLTEADVQREMLSGQLGEHLKNINPEAGLLLDQISEDMKSGEGPGEESLMPLLGGLGITLH